MRTTLLTMLIALLLFEVGLRVVDYRVVPPLSWENQFTQDKADRIEELGSIDLVVVGSSVANASIDAHTLANGGIGYNAALPSYTPRVWAEWFDDVIVPVRPSTVVIAVDIRQYSDNKPGAENQVSHYLQSDGRQLSAGVTRETIIDRVAKMFATSRLKSRLREPDKFFAAVTGIGDIGDWRRTALDEWGRYTRFDDNIFGDSPESLDSLAERAFVDFSVGGAEQDAVLRIIHAARAIDADVVLLMTPSVRTKLATALPNGVADFEDYEAGLRDLAASENIPLLTYEDLNGLENLFADYYHMNAEGSATISARIAEDLADVLAGSS